MSKDNEAIAAWAARKKQRKLEAQATTKALQARVDEQKFPPLDWGKPADTEVVKTLTEQWAAQGFKTVPIETVEEFQEQHQTMPVVKGLSFDSTKQMYRCRAYKNNRQLNLYWGPSLAKALEALAEYRANNS